MLSQQCAAVSSVLAALPKLLRLNKKHTGNCQRVKQTARWCLAGQGLPPTLCYFPLEKKKQVLLQSHGRSGWRCPLHTPNNWSAGLRASGWMSTAQWGEPSRIRICLSTVTFSGQIHERNLPSLLALQVGVWGGAPLSSAADSGPRGWGGDAWDVVSSCGSARGLCGSGYLMTLL